MKHITLLLAIALISLRGCSQNAPEQNNSNLKRVGGPCEGCEAIYESPVAFERLSYIDTLPDFNESSVKIKISGVIYQSDGKTPAKDVVLYFYHTNEKGYYPKKGNEPGWGKRHGYLRSWLKTNAKGEYIFYTLKPAAYPKRPEPAHIHMTIKEPGKNEYYIDDIQFDDDPLLTKEKRDKQQNLGGNGIISLKKINNILKGNRNIILGKNILNYPAK